MSSSFATGHYHHQTPLSDRLTYFTQLFIRILKFLLVELWFNLCWKLYKAIITSLSGKPPHQSHVLSNEQYKEFSS